MSQYIRPDWFVGVKKTRIFNDLVEAVQEQQPDLPVNLHYIGMLAQELHTYVTAQIEIEKQGLVLTTNNGEKRKNPAYEIADKAFMKVEKGFDYLGITMSAASLTENEVKDDLIKSFLDKFGGEK